MKKIICLGLLGTAQTAVPRRADSQRNRGVQQAMLRLVVQPVRPGAGEVPRDGRPEQRAAGRTQPGLHTGTGTGIISYL